MGVAQLLPDAGSHVAADHAVVQHRDAGAADHGVKPVAHHEIRQSPPQRQDHAAMAVLRMHATAPQLHHAGTQRTQPRQVELQVAVGTPYPARLGRREHAVGTDHLTAGQVAHQQVLAIVIEQVHVMARNGGIQARPHLLREDGKPQPLSLPYLIEVPRPSHFQAGTRHRPRTQSHAWAVKCPPGQGRQRQRGIRQFVHRDFSFGPVAVPPVWCGAMTTP